MGNPVCSFEGLAVVLSLGARWVMLCSLEKDYSPHAVTESTLSTLY